jgi:hypothetical protein
MNVYNNTMEIEIERIRTCLLNYSGIVNQHLRLLIFEYMNEYKTYFRKIFMSGRHPNIITTQNLNMERYIHKNYYIPIPFYFSVANNNLCYSYMNKKKLKKKRSIKLLTNGN